MHRCLQSLVFCCSLLALTTTAADGTLEQIRSKGELRVGTDIPYGVMEFYDADGNAVGIDMDIGREIANELDVRMTVVPMPFDQLFDALKAKQVDLLISAVTITPERQEEMLFSAPYLDTGLSLAVREGTSGISSTSDLSGKRLGVLSGTTGEAFAQALSNSAAIDIVSYQKNEERLAALASGDIDASIVHFMTKSTDGIKTVGRPLQTSYYGVVGRLESNALMKEVDQTLRTLKRSGRLDEIKRQYLN